MMVISPFVRVLERKDIIKLRRERIPGREEGLVGRFVRKILFDYRRVFKELGNRWTSRRKISLSIFPDQVARKREISIGRSTIDQLRRVITVSSSDIVAADIG